MFAYIKGLLVSITPHSAVVDVNGIGYSICIPCRTFDDLPQIGQVVQLFTTFIVRELSHALYGFMTHQERDLFEVLMNATGVGPKLGLSIIGHLTVSELQTAIACQDLPTLCRVPGIGKKTAERLVVELKDRVSQFLPLSGSPLPIPSSDSFSSNAQDAMLALINLGYNQSVAQRAIKQSLEELSERADLPSLITAALKNIK
ncbi:MAG: Holliday junction branch migration protein RuvA [Parachlamydiaceae bacterium]